jgi:hypothetical protein
VVRARLGCEADLRRADPRDRGGIVSKRTITVPIHLSEGQHRIFVRDLAKLRRQGAPSNTAAILAAVHIAATRPYTQSEPTKRPGSADTPPARHQEVTS